jgi:hypothetical protein
VKANNSLCGIVIVILFAACALKDPLVGKWKSPDGSTFEFFADGTFLRSEPTSGDFSGEYQLLPDKRLKLDMTMLGSRVMKIYEVVIAKERIKLKDGSEEVPLYRIDGSTAPQEVVGLWKVATEDSKSQPHEDAIYWRLGEGGELLGRIGGIWFVRGGDLYVVYLNGAYWKGEVRGDQILGRLFYQDETSELSEEFESRRLSTNPHDEATAFVACFGRSSTLSCVNAERYTCNSWTGSSFAKLEECVTHCQHEAANRGLRCLN